MQHLSTCSCSRRSFLRGCGLTLTGFGLSSVFPTPLIQQALAGGLGNDKRLMFIFLRGGNDGINAVIPHGDPDYGPGIRPTLHITPQESIDLNGFAALHPGLSDMMDVFDAGELAVIHRVGYQDNSLSHFDAQRVWENGDPTKPNLYEGWLYRYIRENALTAGFDLPVVTVQPASPLVLRGDEKYVNIASPSGFDYVMPDPDGAKYKQNWRDVAENMVGGLDPYRPLLSQTGVKLVDMLDEYASWDQANWNPLDPDTGFALFPVDEATNPNGFFTESSFNFFRSLKVAALAMLESDGSNNGTRISGTEFGGWDSHTFQGGAMGKHAQLLATVAYAFRSLRIVFSGAATDPRNYPAIWDKTVVTTMSEFGRTTVENGSTGTDHAKASAMFVGGGQVNGGVYNCDASSWPAGVMFGVDGNYLLQRTDYRAVFWELLRDHMGTLPGTVETVFPGYGAGGIGSQELGLFGG